MARLFIRHLVIAVTLAFSCAALGSLPWPRIALNRVAGGFSSPTQVTSAHDGTGRLFVVEQRGLVKIVKDGAILPTPFLDITDRVSCCGERGLLSIVFPPGAGPSGPQAVLYANYTDVNGDTTVSQFSVSNDPDVFNSERVFLKIAQPFANHNGGQLAFGPDGYLYVGMGDGGSAGDPNNNGQNLGSLLGKILRLDVALGTRYAIPATNPFVGSATARPEIWAYGLRNPWRFSFDRKTGDLYIGDVGQDAWEEVDVQPAGSAGGENYGWRLTEGSHCFSPATGCPTSGITFPVAEYGHEGGNCSITGGFVYRGRDFARLSGIYFYADYCSGRVWGLRNGASGWETQELLKPGYGFTSFGEDDAGEVYAVDGNSGTLYRLVDADGPLSVLTVPVLVDAAGANGARFVSEITLGNRGTKDASVDVTFTASAAFGSSGSGTFTTTVPAGRQLVFADALQWLRQNGLFIPLGDQGGTLRLAYSGLSSGDAAFASVQTLAVLPGGRAGLAYPALSSNEMLEAPAALYGLREDSSFRSNVALLNAGDPATGGPVTLRVTVFSGADGRSSVFPNVSLGPGQWTQLNRVLASAGYASGWATVERVSGTEPFYAYAVVNDNVTGDGAFAPPLAVHPARASRQTLPVAVETSAFSTEILLANRESAPLTLQLFYQESLGIPISGGQAATSVTLLPGEQRFIPHIVSLIEGAPPAADAAGSIAIHTPSGAAASYVAGARTASPAPGGGTYGTFAFATPLDRGAATEAWIYGLKQDGLSRSNLGLTEVPSFFGAGPADQEPPLILFVDVFDADTGAAAGTQGPFNFGFRNLGWKQVNAILGVFGVRNGYVRIRRTSGYANFLVYGVVNDGAVPGQGTGDGSYLAMTTFP